MDIAQPQIDKLIADMLTGDSCALARLITLVENQSQFADQIGKTISPHLHNAYRIGITGSAGSGKSTLIDSLTCVFRRNELTVGIIAVDPSSTFSGGALLGDRIRMRRHCVDEGVFIRSMATRGSQGGLSGAVRKTIDLIDASGKDIILIETTGVGQTEVSIAEVANTVVVIMVPGYGDDIQLMKPGQIEISNIIVINKANRDGAEDLANGIREIFSLCPAKSVPPIIMAQATNDAGIVELYSEIEKRRPEGTQAALRMPIPFGDG